MKKRKTKQWNLRRTCIPSYPIPAGATILIHPRENAKEVIQEYFDLIGGRPVKPGAKKRKSTASAGPRTPDRAPAKKTKKEQPILKEQTPSESSNDTWVPKGKNWENDAMIVDTIIKDEKSDTLYAMVSWNNGKKSKVSLHLAYQRMPQKVRMCDL